jgi:hypothetical protein
LRPEQTKTTVEPATREAHSVAFLLALASIARSVGGHQLLYARVNWDNLFASASPPGAPSPRIARGSYTRDALRAYHKRRRELRGGLARALAL